MPKYVVLLIGNDERWWSEASEEEHRETYAAHGRFTEQLGAREQIGGYHVVESDDLDDLLECCLVLSATGDAVEVRRCADPEERAS